MTSRDKRILPHNYEFDKEPSPWEIGFHQIAIPIFYDGGGDMQEVNGSSLFDLGQIYNLGLIPIGVVGECKFIITNSIELLRNFAKLPFSYRLPDTVAFGQTIANELERWIQTDNPELTQDARLTLIRNLDTFRTLLFSELGKLTAILLEEKRGYGINALWKNQFDLMAKGVSRHLSIFVKSNLIESAKCLVLNCYTAVGFHTMRSIEHVSRRYYKLIKGKAPLRANGKSMGLGSIAQEFIDLKRSSDDLGIIGSIIKGLCNKKRDPLAHPEIVALKEDEAIDTLIDTLQVISKVVEDAKTKGPHFKNPWKRGYLF